MCSSDLPDHLKLGDAKEISDLRKQRGRAGPGPRGSSRRTTPRNQDYRWGLENILKVYKNEMDEYDFAKINKITVRHARKVIGEMRRGEIYPWLEEYCKNEQ